MTEYKMHLWAHLPGAQIPTVMMEAEDELSAAAMSLLHFKRSGYAFAPRDNHHVDVELPDETTNTYYIRDILHWLALPQRAAFVEREGLGSLLE